MKKRERLVWREGFVVTTIPGSGREEHLSLDGGETTAYFLTELAARVAARRHVPADVPWYPDFVGGFYRRDRQPKLENTAAPWWQNDGPTWFTKAEGAPPAHPLLTPHGVDANVWNAALGVLAISMFP